MSASTLSPSRPSRKRRAPAAADEDRTVDARREAAAAANNASRMVFVLGSRHLNYGCLVLPYLTRSKEARALSATSVEIGVAARRHAWAYEPPPFRVPREPIFNTMRVRVP
jgi:hypothetical protein